MEQEIEKEVVREWNENGDWEMGMRMRMECRLLEYEMGWDASVCSWGVSAAAARWGQATDIHIGGWGGSWKAAREPTVQHTEATKLLSTWVGHSLSKPPSLQVLLRLSRGLPKIKPTLPPFLALPLLPYLQSVCTQFHIPCCLLQSVSTPPLLMRRWRWWWWWWWRLLFHGLIEGGSSAHIFKFWVKETRGPERPFSKVGPKLEDCCLKHVILYTLLPSVILWLLVYALIRVGLY